MHSRLKIIVFAVVILAVAFGVIFVRETPQKIDLYYITLATGSLEEVQEAVSFRPWRINSRHHYRGHTHKVSALERAVINSDVRVLQFLLDNRAVLKPDRASGFPALEFAIALDEKRQPHVAALMKAYMSRNTTASLETAMEILYGMRTRYPYFPDLSEEFSEVDWEKEPPEARYWYILYLARYSSNVALLQRLYDPARDGQRPSLLYAAARYNPEPAVTAFLLEQRPELEHALPVREGEISTVLAVSMMDGNEPVTRFLRDTRNPPTGGAAFSVLVQGMQHPDLAAFRSLLEGGISPNASDGQKRILHHAIDEGFFDHVRVLVECGADAAAVDENGRNALHLLAEPLSALRDRKTTLNQAQTAEFLVKTGIPVNSRDLDGMTPLTTALRHGNWPIAEMLLRHGADASVLDPDKQGAFHKLALTRHNPPRSVIKALQKSGASINHLDALGQSCLAVALKWGSLDAAHALLLAGAPLPPADGKDTTWFHVLAAPGYGSERAKDADLTYDPETRKGGLVSPHPLFALLAQKGVDVNARNGLGLRPLAVALKNNNILTALNFVHIGATVNWPGEEEPSALDLLLRLDEGGNYRVPFFKAGADVNLVSGDHAPWFRFFEDYSFLAGEEYIAKDIALWQKAGLDLNLRDASGQTALHRCMVKKPSEGGPVKIPPNAKGISVILFIPEGQQAIKGSKFALVLCEAGADVNATNMEGFTPFELLLQQNWNSEIFGVFAKFLLEQGASMRASSAWKNSGGEHFIKVFFRKYMYISDDLFALMIRNGLDLNERDSQGSPIMHSFFTASKVRPKIIQTALENGWDASAKDAKGKTALEYLKRDGEKYHEIRTMIESFPSVKSGEK